MDISNIKPAEQRPVEILHPRTNEPIGLTIYIRPDTHPEVEAVRRKNITAAVMRRGALTDTIIDNSGLDLLVASCAGWDWSEDLTIEGQKLEFTPANVRKLLVNYKFIKNQVDAAVGDQGAFY